MVSSSSGSGALPAVGFADLAFAFSSAALYYLGEASLEGKPVGERNLPLARHNIDILCLLREKTRGNLGEDEAEMLERLIVDLQLKFVEASRLPPRP